ncbi:MAG TPA: hypothetical protein VFD97_06580 [Acidimicrobiia bacterium]|nr:hypothetical protein [Acidimicrobiia bacterium]
MTDGIDPKAERSIRSSQTIRIVAVLVAITVLAVWAIANTSAVVTSAGSFETSEKNTSKS